MPGQVFIPWRQTPYPPPQERAPPSILNSVAKPIDYFRDLESTQPSVYAEFRHIDQAWTADVTHADFHACVRLMHSAGHISEAEFLLRTNLLVSGDGRSWTLDDVGLDLYSELFGDAKREQFSTAISAFGSQFCVQFSNGAGGGFQAGYEAVISSDYFDRFRMQNRRCYVRFEFFQREFVNADVEEIARPDQLVSFRWMNDTWKETGIGIHTQSYD